MNTAIATVTAEHTIVATPLGEVTVVRDGDALTGLYFPHHWYMPNRSTFGPRSEQGFDEAARQLHEYFAGRRRAFDLPLAPRGDAFQHSVWDLIRQVPYGQTSTYGELAGLLGDGVSAQKVGAAVGRNPLSVIVACHRIVGRNGKLTGYAGGIARKQALLDLEESTCRTGGKLF